jgi:CubicO group peptidase (beta-lactamase class C family)
VNISQILLGILLLLSSFRVTFATPQLKTIEDLRSHIEKKGFNGVVLVMKNNKVLFKEAFGHKNLIKKNPLTVNDRFQIGSITKQFVAAAILKLQEDDRLSINDSITKYLPQYPKWRNIKIKDVLNHTSGIVNYTAHSEFMSARRPYDVLTLDRILDYSYRFKVDFVPRSKFKYSNAGYIVAGKIIEATSGMKWDEYIRKNFLLPLGLYDTGHNNFFEEVSNVIGHEFKNGNFSLVQNLNLSWALSAGSFYSTVDDLAKWSQIFENSSLLSNKSLKAMLKPGLGNYGMGVFITSYGSDTLINHTGVTKGFHSKMYYLKKSKINVITLDNTDGKASDVSDNILSFFYSRK